LHGVVGLVLFWVVRFHTTDGASFPFAWKEDPTKEFNLHPVLMIVGLIYFMGQGLTSPHSSTYSFNFSIFFIFYLILLLHTCLFLLALGRPYDKVTDSAGLTHGVFTRMIHYLH
jgi:hypothetical protein